MREPTQDDENTMAGSFPELPEQEEPEQEKSEMRAGQDEPQSSPRGESDPQRSAPEEPVVGSTGTSKDRLRSLRFRVDENVRKVTTGIRDEETRRRVESDIRGRATRLRRQTESWARPAHKAAVGGVKRGGARVGEAAVSARRSSSEATERLRRWDDVLILRRPRLMVWAIGGLCLAVLLSFIGTISVPTMIMGAVTRSTGLADWTPLLNFVDGGEGAQMLREASAEVRGKLIGAMLIVGLVVAGVYLGVMLGLWYRVRGFRIVASLLAFWSTVAFLTPSTWYMAASVVSIVSVSVLWISPHSRRWFSRAPARVRGGT